MTTYYHGTQAALQPGDMLTPQAAAANGHRDHLSPGYVFATTRLALARQYGNGAPGGATRQGYIYEVQPVGPVEQDPADVAGSYRTRHPLRVVRLVEVRPVSEGHQTWQPACGQHRTHFAWGCEE
jgi:hypothetical protein